MAMSNSKAAPSPPPSERLFLLLSDMVEDFAYYAVADQTAFRIVKCRRREAYGCGPNGDAIVRGLAIFVRLGGRDDDPYTNPKLCLYATDEVFDRVGSEIGERQAKLYGRRTRFSARVCTVDGNIMVIRVSFLAGFSRGQDFRSYYLVYNSAAASLFLLPRRRPTSSSSSCTTTTTPLKIALAGQDDADDNYSLLELTAEISGQGSVVPLLCLWSPPSPDDDDNNSSSRGAWQVKQARRLGEANSFADPFKANVVFSCLFNGNSFAVWGDLAQGIMYCNCSDLMADPQVDFKHIVFPPEFGSMDNMKHMDMEALEHYSLPLYRTMGCVGDSIWFVTIEPNYDCPPDTMVKVWTLDLLSDDEEKKWNPHREFRMMEVLTTAQQGLLPNTAVPKFPILRPRRQADCALYMLLPEPYSGGIAVYGHLVCIDLSSRYEEVRLQSSRRLAIPLMGEPVVLDPDFFSESDLSSSFEVHPNKGA